MVGASAARDYPLKGSLDGTFKSFSTGYFAAIFNGAARTVLLAEREGGWNLPGGGAISAEEGSPAVILPRAVKFWTGLQLVEIGPQIGPDFPGLMGEVMDTCRAYMCKVAEEDTVLGKGKVACAWFDRKSIRKIRLMGPENAPGRMSQMIFDALRVLDVPDDMFQVPCEQTEILQGMVPMSGAITLNHGGKYLVEHASTLIKVWRRVRPIIKDEHVVGEEMF